MAVVNKFNVNKEQVTLDADIIENMSANDVSYNASTQYDENTVGDKLSELDQYLSSLDNSIANIPILETLLKEDYITEQITKTLGYYNVTDGSLLESDRTGYFVSQKINVLPGSVIRLKTLVTSPNVASYVFYRKDSSVDVDNIGGVLDYTYKDIVIPDDIYYVAFSCYDNKELIVEIPKASRNVYTKEEINKKIPEIINDLEQGGTSKALSAEMGKNIGSDIYVYKNEDVSIDIDIYTEDGISGYYNSSSGNFVKADTRCATAKINVIPGEIYKVTNNIGSSPAISYLAQWGSNDEWIGTAENFTANSGNAIDREYIVPEGVTKIAISSYNTTEPQLKKVIKRGYKSFYTKEEVYNKEEIDEISKSEGEEYGIKWETNNEDDLGQRCFKAIGLTAVAGIGNTDGYSDFDNIYPWSEMKRCNIKTNSAGAKIITFEGEEGFTLDGSNGDVFVRIPKFYYNRYRKDGYDYRTVSRIGTNVHPAFIEDGKELDEIFVAAFEGHVKGDLPEYLGEQLEDFMNAKLFSIGSTEQQNTIPTPNYTISQYLKFATDKGVGYTLYDMRTMDAIWTLFAVEFGCRNTNRKIAYGYCDLKQPISGVNNLEIASSAPTNTIIIPNGASGLANKLYVGSSITICKGEQTNIIALRKITGNVFDTNTKSITITFDGDPISFIQGETDYFVGSGPASSNLCETLPNDAKLNWHTGRANITQVGLNADMINPCRYRWIENPMGSLWHFFPDVCFKYGQMYICNNLRNYKAVNNDVSLLEGYYPVGEPFEATPDTNDSGDKNGDKNDEPSNINPFVITLDNNIFAKGVSIGRTYKQGITSKQAFGAYYYMYNSDKQSGIYYIANGGGFDHTWRSNMLTNRAWQVAGGRWYLYGARLIYKNI